ncbi:SDR family NAD(P)-dependent oxidoreductase [Bryobacter aggregatus]|uniref:SDR family NAD(P)-dependent oxidoreductase n=1 Tax=Bryobacter aggregatus TaxID=360054 RepID=UPI0004E22AD3|nr:SDR family oxidoreductase [Bryobacter aggregatus]
MGVINGAKAYPVDGLNVVITGAGRGIGKRLAIGFAARGARVGLVARTGTELDLTDLEIKHAGGISHKLAADVRDFERVSGVLDLMRHRNGPIQVLICAAGIQGPIGPFHKTIGKLWLETIDTNLMGVVNSCRAVIPRMIENRRGKIIVLAGGGAAAPRPNFTAYATSKAAVVRFCESLAEELREHNIQVNCFSPGGSYTSMTDEILSARNTAGWKEIEAAEKIQHSGGVKPEKQIDLACFLASEVSNHISGKFLHVDDDWKRLVETQVTPDLYTLRRLKKA